jgi:hypothetical protein
VKSCQDAITSKMAEDERLPCEVRQRVHDLAPWPQLLDLRNAAFASVSAAAQELIVFRLFGGISGLRSGSRQGAWDGATREASTLAAHTLAALRSHEWVPEIDPGDDLGHSGSTPAITHRVSSNWSAGPTLPRQVQKNGLGQRPVEPEARMAAAEGPGEIAADISDCAEHGATVRTSLGPVAGRCGRDGGSTVRLRDRERRSRPVNAVPCAI